VPEAVTSSYQAISKRPLRSLVIAGIATSYRWHSLVIGGYIGYYRVIATSAGYRYIVTSVTSLVIVAIGYRYIAAIAAIATSLLSLRRYTAPHRCWLSPLSLYRVTLSLHRYIVAIVGYRYIRLSLSYRLAIAISATHYRLAISATSLHRAISLVIVTFAGDRWLSSGAGYRYIRYIAVIVTSRVPVMLHRLSIAPYQENAGVPLARLHRLSLHPALHSAPLSGYIRWLSLYGATAGYREAVENVIPLHRYQKRPRDGPVLKMLRTRVSLKR
jgi:hypothetical protein